MRLPRRKLSEEVARLLLREIRAQGMTAGTRIPSERELMARLGVGRSTVREVVNGLAMLGALEIRHGQGVFVLDPDAGIGAQSTIAAALARGVTRDLFEAQRLVETQTARLAAKRRTDRDLGMLIEILDEHARAVAEQLPAVEHAVRFHVRLASVARNEILTRTVESIGELLIERAPALETIAGYREWELREHRAVIVPIRDGDPAAAGQRMSEHLDGAAAWHDRLAQASELRRPVG